MRAGNIVIVGTGQAGFQAAASLRQEGFDGELLMIGDERGLPYQRPPLSKAYLHDGHEERLLLRNADFFTSNRIDVETSVPVTEISLPDRYVSLSDRRRYRFDHLILATGTRARKLSLPGLTASNVFEMRTLGDARRVREALNAAENIIVLGGGFIGLEFACVARKLGKNVTVIEAASRLMGRAVTREISDFFQEAHKAAGIAVMIGDMVSSVELSGGRRAVAVTTAKGIRLECDLILVAAGVVPNCELASYAGLAVENGIAVDALMATNAPHVSAIGDCVSFPYQNGRVRLESVQNAVDQARCIAKRLAGTSEKYSKLPWFWSDQGDHKLQIAGFSMHVDDLKLVDTPGSDAVTVLSFSKGILVAVETVNSPGNHMTARKLLARPERTSLAQLKDYDFDLRGLASLAT